MLERGEARNGAGPWATDLYAAGDVLSAKRLGRGWDGGVAVLGFIGGVVGEGGEKDVVSRMGEKEVVGGRQIAVKNEEEKEWEGIKGLLEWRGGKSGVEIYPGPLPWDESHT